MNVEALQELIALYCNVLHLFKKIGNLINTVLTFSVSIKNRHRWEKHWTARSNKNELERGYPRTVTRENRESLKRAFLSVSAQTFVIPSAYKTGL